MTMMMSSTTSKNPKRSRSRSRSRFRPRTSHALRIRAKASRACRRRTCGGGGDVVSGKLEALKNLVPSRYEVDEVVGADRLFQETADYIMVLRAQVVVLQTLIHFYGSSDLESPNVV